MRQSDKSNEVIARNFARWSKLYNSSNGRAWGSGASPTVRLLLNAHAFEILEAQHDQLTILEIGAGYGRDTAFMAELDHKIIAFENAVGALDVSSQPLKKRIGQNVSWMAKNYLDYKGFENEIFDVVYSHRTLHLLTEQSMVARFKEEVVRTTKPGSIICISARDTRDFNLEQMVWVNEDQGIAQYTLPDREGHVISFWSAQRYKKVFGDHFDIVSLTQAIELESVTNAKTDSHFTIMLGVKR